MAAQLGDQGSLSKGFAYLVLFLVCAYMAGFGLSWDPLGWLVPIEIFQLEIRSAAQSVTEAVGFLFTFIIAQTFLSMLCHFKTGIFFFFGGWVALMTGFVYSLLPEIKNLPIELMDQIWEEHWFWKRIVRQEIEERKMEHRFETDRIYKSRFPQSLNCLLNKKTWIKKTDKVHHRIRIQFNQPENS